MGRQWHQLDHMQIIRTSLQTDNHASTSSVSFYSPDVLPATQSTASKQQSRLKAIWEIVNWLQVQKLQSEPQKG